LPPESAVGRDQEKEIYTPGIWGDVTITCVGGARVKLVQVIPHIDRSTAEVRVWIQNLEFKREALLVSVRLFEKKSGEAVSPIMDTRMMLPDHATGEYKFELPLDTMKLWSPDRPFLYEAEVTVEEGHTIHDSLRMTFGMREFTIRGADFFLNGTKILLRGSNIAFHRFLSDKQRKLLPWNTEWIKKALIDLPKEHNFNFFRNHLGQMYNAWYDIADEHGMLIQNEWQFWCVTGTDVQIRKEFTEWLHDNWNHPSIIMWDPINEASDDTVQTEIVAEMKELDPTRPWESVDFLEEHPYIYSLGMVLNNRRFGFSRSLNEIENLPVPSMLNEFLWWWFNDQWEPTVLTKMIVQRWMGRTYTNEDVIAHQSFLARELIEQFRRMRVKAIQPFVYISNNDGPTAHWFLGDIKDLQPKPLMKAIRDAFAPFAVSIELWDRHFIVKKEYTVRVFVFNDSPFTRRGVLKFGVLSSDRQWIAEKDIPVEIGPVSDAVFTETFNLPNALDEWSVSAQLTENGSVVSFCKKITHAIHPPTVPSLKQPVGLFDPSKEIETYLRTTKVAFQSVEEWNLNGISTVIVNGNVLGSRKYSMQKVRLTEFVHNGGTLILIEPEFRVVGSAVHPVIDGIDLTIAQRADADKGGYDSYVFAESPTHPLWRNVPKEYLKLFNGSYGGEIVSQYDVNFTAASERLASCGMDLAVTAASEVTAGKGKIVLFRLQVRGRLIESGQKDSLYARRVDPVAQQLLMNLLEYGERSAVMNRQS
jgi:beta-galactosidase